MSISIFWHYMTKLRKKLWTKSVFSARTIGKAVTSVSVSSPSWWGATNKNWGVKNFSLHCSNLSNSKKCLQNNEFGHISSHCAKDEKKNTAMFICKRMMYRTPNLTLMDIARWLVEMLLKIKAKIAFYLIFYLYFFKNS